jgi:septal ring factor EnvC (AmiA/AmiB activator)
VVAEDVQANPMARVVQLLNDLKLQVEKDGEKEKVLYEKFMCWCESGGAEEEESLRVQKERIERLHPAIASAEEQVATLTDQISEIAQDIAAHEQAKRGADALRGKEEETYKTESENLKQSIAALKKAIAVLQKARDAASFMQAASAVKVALTPFSQSTVVRTILEDRQIVALLNVGSAGSAKEFLQTSGGAQFAPDHILGVLQGLLDAFTHDLSNTEKTEADAVAAYNSLVSSKGEELRAAHAMSRQVTEEKTGLAAQLARDKDDIAATQVSFAQDQTAFANRKAECETKTQQFHARQQARLEEQLAINEAVAVLMQDDVHVTFQKTASRAPMSFLQLQAGPAKDPHDVLVYIQELAKANPGKPVLAQLAARLGSMDGGSFDRVIQVINKQIEIIDMEQADDDQKFTWCKSEGAKLAQTQKVKKDEIADLTAQIGNIDGDLKMLKDEASTLAKETDELDRLLADAGRQRADESSSFDEGIAELKAAQQALVKAIQVLEGFYGQQALLQAETAARQPQSNVQISTEYYEGSDPPPTPTGDYTGAPGGQNILKLLATLGEDLVKEEEMQRKDEETAKEAYNALAAQTATNRKLKSEQLLMRREQIATLEQNQDMLTNDLDSAKELLGELRSRELDLAKDCYILDEYDRRKSLRGGEGEAMKKAIQILS